MTSDDYVSHLGKLVGNLHSLEVALRLALARSRPTEGRLPSPSDLATSQLGTLFPASCLTDYASLGQLITAFNELMRTDGKPQINENLVALRDAIAHGRIVSDRTIFPVRLVKFDRPDSEGNVRIVFNEILDLEWFTRNIRFVYESVLIVSNYSRGSLVQLGNDESAGREG